MPMPPEETITSDTPQPTPESPTPTIEAPAPVIEPATPPQEASPVPVEPEPVPSEPVPPAETTTAQELTPTAQIPPNEPIAPEPEPIQPPAAAAPAQTHSIRDLLNKARIAIQDRKRKKRDKIMQALNTKNKITNDEVEKLLHVSDATATRYLSALEKEGRIRQVGKTGHGVVYSRVQ